MVKTGILRLGYLLAILIFAFLVFLNFINISNSSIIWISTVMESLFVTGSLIVAYLLISRGFISNDKWALIIGLSFLSTVIPTITWLLSWHNFRGQSVIPTPVSTHIWVLYFRDLLFGLIFLYLIFRSRKRSLSAPRESAYVIILSLATSVFIATPPFLPDIIRQNTLLPINSIVSSGLLFFYIFIILYTYNIYRKTRTPLLLIFIIFLLIYSQGLIGFALSSSRLDIEWYFGKVVNLFAFGILITYLISEYTGYFIDSLVASSLQLSLNPKMPAVDWLQIDAQYRPATKQAAVGGDWYDIIELEKEKVAIIVGDAIGKGVKAIPTMTEAKFLLRGYLLEGVQPDLALSKVNNYLVKYLSSEEFVTMAIGIIDKSSGTMQYTLAGHPPPIMITGRDWQFLNIPKPKLPLGIAKNVSYDLTKIPVTKGSIIAYYSDGVIEARQGDKFFEDSGLVEFLLKNQFQSPQAINSNLIQTITSNWQAIDDVTSVIVKVTF